MYVSPFSCYELLSEMNEWMNKSLFAQLSTRTMTILYKLHREHGQQDSKNGTNSCSK